MSKSSFYIGVDVGASELVAALEGRKPRCFKHSRPGIKAMVKWAGKIAGESTSAPAYKSYRKMMWVVDVLVRRQIEVGGGPPRPPPYYGAAKLFQQISLKTTLT